MAVSAVDLYFLQQEEKKAGKEASVSLKNALKSAINKNLHLQTYNAVRTANSIPKYKDNRLQRLTMQAPDYVFKNNYGFEGKKSNGVNMRLKSTDLINQALDESKVLDSLVDKIATLRGDRVALAISFIKYGAY
jgi:hypothetical protein